MQHTSLQIIRDEHSALAAMLRSMRLLVEIGPGEKQDEFFDMIRAMLFYIDEFPERKHHPKESDLLFPRVARRAPHLMQALTRLEHDHIEGEWSVRELQHQLVAWELLGETRKEPFLEAFHRYVDFYLDHMQLEETVILPAAQKLLNETEWQEMDAAFEENRDPLTGKYRPDPAHERLFQHILIRTPIPVRAVKT